ncbi:5162_t:CDS:2 [Dentiscutata erythropus]|uniref:5162_t:CDS:1 n=1 Tax=Dentiscutata erythropus TaxID=1348616 RepID=A0A9N9GU61_9GLOM|nr:5162_t:CDS:2 [Dentiscutata erythropus]
MLKAIGCTEIMPFNKDQSEVTFWSRSHNSEIDKTNLELLYKQGFLNLIPSNFKNHTLTFWECFCQTLDKNKRGFNETSVSYLQPNRDRGTRSNTLSGNSNWFEWQWPIDEDLEEKLQKHEINKPTSHNSTPTTPISNWYIPPPNPAHIDNIFSLRLGWALKENQKFGKKSARKQMSKKVRALLEGFFIAENANKSDRYNAQDIYRELLKCADEGEISTEEVPKLTTIQN